jgi:hypothetical protein
MFLEFSGNMEIKLTEQNFVMFAMKNYLNPQCLDMSEFYDDVKRIKYIKRLLGRYVSSGQIKERLVLNHIIILYNVFGVNATTKMLFFKIDKKFWPQLKTFLVYLNYMPEVLHGVSDSPIIASNIPLDSHIISILRAI